MANAVNFTTSELDFDSIVNSLREYLNYQTEFKDYNFKGSALSTLINLLAYNTHYNGVYDNFAVNESFLDSAQKRESVVSHANVINYIPRSAKGAEAVVDIMIHDDDYDVLNTIGEGSLSIPKYSVFTTEVDGVDYTFYTDSTNTLTREGSIFTATGVHLRQGTFITLQRVYNGNSAQKFVLNGINVDTDTIGVQVLHDQNLYTFTRADNILANDGTSKVYFLSMTSDDHYQIEFGSGVLGYSLNAGDIVYITYLAVGNNPTACNGASVFSYQGQLSNFGGFSTSAVATVTTTQRAIGGAVAESTESIRMLAPKIYTTQDRCVTVADYKAMLLKNFDNIKAINVWGGEDNDPPEYGKVFISVIPNTDPTLSELEKNTILSILKDKKELTKIIEFVDPKYLSVNIESTVHYDSALTTNSEKDIEGIVRDTIISFGANNLQNFGDVLRFSQLSKEIDECEQSIVNNTTRLRLSADVEPVYDQSYSYTISLNNSIYQAAGPQECVLSNMFKCYEARQGELLCYIDDNPITKTLRLCYKDDNDNKVVLLNNCGTIDYENGVINITGLTITDLMSPSWTFTVNPSSYDVVGSVNQFTILNNSELVVHMVDDRVKPKYIQSSIK